MKIESIKKIREICQEKAKGGGFWYVEAVLRKISIYFTWLFLLTPISPNQISILSLIPGLAASILFSTGQAWGFLIGAICLQLYEIIDCCDGEVARYRRQTSSTGKYVDMLVETVVHPFVYVGIALGIATASPNNYKIAFLLGIATIVGTILYEIVQHFSKHYILFMELYWFLEKEGYLLPQFTKNLQEIKKSKKEESGHSKFIFSIADAFLKFAGLVNFITIFAILGFIAERLDLGLKSANLFLIFLWIYAISLWFFGILRVIQQIKNKVPDQAMSQYFNDSPEK